MTLGDSFTEGVGTPNDSTWSVLLEENLYKQKFPYYINVINGGHNGSDPAICLYSFKKELESAIQPDMVILAINNSDVTDFIDRGGYERFTNGKGTSPWWEFIFGFSYGFRIFILDVLKYDYNFIKDESRNRINNEASQKLVETISLMKAFCESKKIEFYLVIMPHQYELEENVLNNGLAFFYNELIETTNIIYLPDYYKKKLSETNTYPSQYYWQLDYHHNSKGYKMMADGISEKLSINLEQILSNKNK